MEGAEGYADWGRGVVGGLWPDAADRRRVWSEAACTPTMNILEQIQNEPDKPHWLSNSSPTKGEIEWARFAKRPRITCCRAPDFRSLAEDALRSGNPRHRRA